MIWLKVYEIKKQNSWKSKNKPEMFLKTEKWIDWANTVRKSIIKAQIFDNCSLCKRYDVKIVTRWTADLLDWTLKEEEPAWHSDVISVFQVKNGDVCTRRKNAHAFGAHCQICLLLTLVSNFLIILRALTLLDWISQNTRKLKIPALEFVGVKQLNSNCFVLLLLASLF